MGNKKAIFEIFSFIPWFFIIIIALFIFTFLFININEKANSKAQVEDSAVDWEAGYLALAAAQYPVTLPDSRNMTLAELLTLEKREVHGIIPGEILTKIESATVPDAREIHAAIVSEDEKIICGGGQWESAGGSRASNTMCGLNQDKNNRAKINNGLNAYVAATREEYENQGSVGIVFLPTQPASAIIVVVVR